MSWTLSGLSSTSWYSSRSSGTLYIGYSTQTHWAEVISSLKSQMLGCALLRITCVTDSRQMLGCALLRITCVTDSRQVLGCALLRITCVTSCPWSPDCRIELVSTWVNWFSLRWQQLVQPSNLAKLTSDITVIERRELQLALFPVKSPVWHRSSGHLSELV